MGVANISGNILTDSGASLSSYLPLTGGTLTGALNGTSSTFSSFVGINGSPATAFPLEAYINSSTAYSSTSRGNVMRVYNSNTGANVFAGIELGGAGTANDGLAGINGIVTGSGSAALSFYTRNGGTFGERVRFAGDGNIGFGTGSDIVSTNLTGAVTIRKSYNGDTPNGATTQAYYANQSALFLFGRNSGVSIISNNNEEGSIIFGNNSTNAYASIVAGSGSTSAGGDMYFKVGSNTERMRITSGGRVGIQNTAPQGKLEVGIVDSTTTQGGLFFSTFQVPVNTWYTVFYAPNNTWNAITEFTWTSAADYNRSGAAYMRWAYNGGSASLGVVYTLFNNDQNAAASFRNNGGQIQVYITGGAADYYVQVRIQGSRAA